MSHDLGPGERRASHFLHGLGKGSLSPPAQAKTQVQERTLPLSLNPGQHACVGSGGGAPQWKGYASAWHMLITPSIDVHSASKNREEQKNI